MAASERVELKHKMGKSPIIGYWLTDTGDGSVGLSPYRAKGNMRMWTRLPVEPDDLAAVIRALIKHCKAPLSLQALLVEQEKGG